MIVELPYKFTRDTMYNFLDRVIDKNLNPINNFITVDFSTLTEFIEPAGVTILCNIFEWLKSKKNMNLVLWYPNDTNFFNETDPIRYLDNSKFFEQYVGNNITKNPRVKPTTIPLQLVTYERSYQWLEQTFTPWLALQLKVSLGSLTSIKMCFGEIFNNIRDHAFENTGCIFAQHYPRKNIVSIAISDFGVGIPNNIRKIEPDLNDAQALFKAIQEGVTSRTSPRNLGAGLHTLYKNVVEQNGGSIFIHSGYGILNCTSDNNGPKVQSYLRNSYYPGTLIEVILRTDNIYKILDEEEEFDW